MTNTSVREQVVTAAGSYARSYPTHVDAVVSAIEANGSVQAGKDYLTSVGFGAYAYLLDGVTVGTESGFVEFDADAACDVIRAFITDGSPHLVAAGASGASPEQVTALLQIAGLEDVPEPVVEASVEGSVDPGLFRRLVEFARGKGFRG